MLRLSDVHTYYGKSHILHGVSVEVRPGEVVGLLGRNGVGKSTTLKSVMGLVQPSEGRITFEDRDITGIAPHRVAHLGIAYVPEDRRIFRLLSVLENLRTGLDRPGLGEARRAALLDKVYASFPVLRERRNQLGGTLSGGEQQMLAIARALMAAPKLLMLDEPSLGLAPLIVRKVYEVIAELRKSGVTVLVVEQAVHVALTASDRTYVMNAGAIVMAGRSAELRGTPGFEDAYFGAGPR
jgi:branched-chain amino acid transport system ATP-binding protein